MIDCGIDENLDLKIYNQYINIIKKINLILITKS